MKNISLEKFSLRSYVYIFCVLIIASVFTGSCKKCCDTEVNRSNFDDDLHKELIVWRKPGSSPEDFSAWLKKVTHDDKLPVEISAYCQGCDSSLMLMRGRAIEIYIQEKFPARGSLESSQGAPNTGEDGQVYFSLNYEVTFNDFIEPAVTSAQLPTGFIPRSTGDTVNVAVFDTGLDTTSLSGFNRFLFNSTREACIPGARLGWNFVEPGSAYYDDHTPKHGTSVSLFVIRQSNSYWDSLVSPVNILPVKTHNSNGSARLFQILCGFAYASERGVKIINASFGFYVPRLETGYADNINPNARLFREYVKHYLTSRNILLIAAAGNLNADNLRAAFDRDKVLPYPQDNRNLDLFSFYPASLARDPELQNVITVTTVHRNGNSVSPYQHYSAEVVDIGVRADLADGERYLFYNPRNQSKTVEGSSFAAPKIAGMLGAHYHRYKHLVESSQPVKKEDLMNIFESIGIIFRNDSLNGQVRSGRVLNR